MITKLNVTKTFDPDPIPQPLDRTDLEDFVQKPGDQGPTESGYHPRGTALQPGHKLGELHGLHDASNWKVRGSFDRNQHNGSH